LGIKGRRNEPIYGFDRHGNPLTIIVQQGFPPIRIGIGANELARPMQVILCNVGRVQDPKSYNFLPDSIDLPITTDLFEEVIDEVPSDVNCAALWADGDILPVNHWRLLSEAFVSWSNSKNLAAMLSVASTQNSAVPFTIEWNADYTLRGLTKIGFMYAMSKMDPEGRLSDSFRYSRRYILQGIPYPSSLWPSTPIVQWNGPHPGQAVWGDKNFTYLLATVNTDTGLFSFVHLHNLGLFAMKLAESEDDLACPDTLTTYIRSNSDDDRYVLNEEPAPPEEAATFAQTAEAAKQL
jgi:hypothetical protein